jgi:hypothetical protein
MAISAKMLENDFRMIVNGTNLNENSLEFLRLIFVQGQEFKKASLACNLEKSRPYQLKKQFETLLNKKLQEQDIEPVIMLVPTND